MAKRYSGRNVSLGKDGAVQSRASINLRQSIEYENSYVFLNTFHPTIRARSIKLLRKALGEAEQALLSQEDKHGCNTPILLDVIKIFHDNGYKFVNAQSRYQLRKQKL